VSYCYILSLEQTKSFRAGSLSTWKHRDFPNHL